MKRGKEEEKGLEQEKLLQAVGAIYRECYYCDAKNDSFLCLKSSGEQSLEENDSYAEAVCQMAEKKVGKKYLAQVKRKLSLPYIRAHVDEDTPFFLIDYKTREGSLYYWCRISVSFVDTDFDGELWHFSVNFHKDDGDRAIIDLLYRLCYKVVLLDLTTESYWYIKNDDEDARLAIKEHRKISDNWRECVTQGIIYPEDAEQFQNFLNVEWIKKQFSQGMKHLERSYRRFVGGKLRWSTCEIWRAQKYTPENPRVVITIKCVSEELEEVLWRSTQKVVQVENLKSSMLQYFSKDLRNPVRVIAGMGNNIEEALKKGDREKIEGCLRQLQRLGSYISSQLDNIMMMSSMENMENMEKAVKFVRGPMLLSDFFEDCNEYMQQARGEKVIDFSILCGIDVKKEYYADRNMLEKVVFSLLLNAVNFSSSGGRVELIFRRIKENVSREEMNRMLETETKETAEVTEEISMGDILEICISDTGTAPGRPGKEEEPIPKEAESLKDGMPEMGMGLAIVKNVMDAVGGRVRVESQKDRGSSFFLTLFLSYVPKKNDRNEEGDG